MAKAILDEEFQLIKLVKISSHSQTYFGRNSSSCPVLIRILYKAEQFFDELARYFALDHLDCIPKLIAHFPPCSMGGVETLNTPELQEILVTHQRHYEKKSGLANNAEANFDCGVLVTEWIEGPCLTSLWPNLSATQQISYLRKICHALESIHQLGESHGQIQPDHILLKVPCQQPVFIGLGYYPGKTAEAEMGQFPEDGKSAGENSGSEMDMYSLAHHFLSENPFTKKHKITSLCLSHHPEKRPSIGKLSAFLREISPDRNRQSLNTPFVRWLISAAVLILSILLISIPRKVLQVPEDPQISQAGLADLIRTKRPTRPSQLLDEYDLQKPIALFIFQENVMLIGRNQIYCEGEEVTYRGQTLRISQLTPQSIYLSNSSQHVKVAFVPFDTAASPDASETGVFIWEQPNNLPRLLKALAAVYKSFPPLPRTQMVCLLDLLARNPEGTIAIRGDSIYGSFREKSFDLFVNHLDGLILFEKVQRGYQISLGSDSAVL